MLRFQSASTNSDTHTHDLLYLLVKCLDTVNRGQMLLYVLLCILGDNKQLALSSCLDSSQPAASLLTIKFKKKRNREGDRKQGQRKKVADECSSRFEKQLALE